MPVRKLCAEPGCYRRTSGTRCPEHQRAHNQRRNMRPEHQAHQTREYRLLKARVLALAGFRCHWCGGHADTCDFVMPLARGGRMVIDNAVAACGSCNSSRGATVRR